MRHVILLTLLVAVSTAPILFADVTAEEPPLPKSEGQKMERDLDRQIAALADELKKAPRDVMLHSRRGDAYFFRGKIKEAVADYERMVELDGTLATSHWRRGIAYFYARRYDDAARQFEIYHTFDNVDRENGIWRYLSQAKAHGIKRARKGLLKYRKDDREPFGDVFRMFSAKMTGKEILERIRTATVSDDEREKRLFYAYLYIGLNESIEKRPAQALKHLREAVKNRWGRKAGFGPRFMWHVGRIHHDLLQKEAKRRRP